MNAFLSLALFIIALTFPRPVACPEETLDAYTSRVGTIIHGVSIEAETPEEAAMVTVVFYEESRFRLDIHSGERLGDGGKAKCLGQIHPHAKDWDYLAGTDLESTRRCAAQSLRHLRWGLRNCAPRKGTDEVRAAYAYAYYATGHCTEPDEKSLYRAKQWRKLMALLKKAEKR